jgi:hypothetical protein
MEVSAIMTETIDASNYKIVTPGRNNDDNGDGDEDDEDDDYDYDDNYVRSVG